MLPTSDPLLPATRRAATTLLTQLFRHQSDLTTRSPALPPEVVQEGERALSQTIDVIQNLLHTLPSEKE